MGSATLWVFLSFLLLFICYSTFKSYPQKNGISIVI